MANSHIVEKVKNIVIKEMIKDDLLIKAIDPPKELNIKQPQELMNKVIFSYNQDPLTLQNVQTFLTVLVQIPDNTRARDFETTFIYPVLEIYIISHYRHMNIDNIPKVRANRNDYIAELLDNKFNGRGNWGVGRTYLTSNLEGAARKDYLYRHLTFRMIDLNDSLCDDITNDDISYGDKRFHG